MYLYEMTSAQIDAMAERHFDRMLEEWESQFADEPWDTDEPGWSDIAELLDDESWATVLGYLRDWMEGDGDLMMEVYKAGLLDGYIHPEERIGADDPDKEFDMVDRVFAREWENDHLMKSIYIWLPENHFKAMCEWLVKGADHNGIRDLYNKAKRWE